MRETLNLLTNEDKNFPFAFGYWKIMIIFPTSGTLRNILQNNSSKTFCKLHNYEVDPWDSVLKAPESNNPTVTGYPGQCQQNLSTIDKSTYGTKQVHIQQHNMEQGA